MKISDISVDPSKNISRSSAEDEEDFAKLKASIKEIGIQVPLNISYADPEKLRPYLTAGFRRYRAAQELGIEDVPVHEGTAEDYEVNAVENIMRRDINPMEFARLIQRLVERQPDLRKDQICNMLGISRTSMTQKLNLLDLSPLLQDALASGRIGIQQANLISRNFTSDEDVTTWIELAESLPTRGLENAINLAVKVPSASAPSIEMGDTKPEKESSPKEDAKRQDEITDVDFNDIVHDCNQYLNSMGRHVMEEYPEKDIDFKIELLPRKTAKALVELIDALQRVVFA